MEHNIYFNVKYFNSMTLLKHVLYILCMFSFWRYNKSYLILSYLNIKVTFLFVCMVALGYKNPILPQVA